MHVPYHRSLQLPYHRSLQLLTFLLCLVTVQMFQENLNITFLGHQIPYPSWIKLQTTIDCWAKIGVWSKCDANSMHLNVGCSNSSSAYSCKSKFSSAGYCPQAASRTSQYFWNIEACAEGKSDEFSKDDLCSIFSNEGNIMFLGDSLNVELFISFSNILAKLQDNGPCDFWQFDKFDCPHVKTPLLCQLERRFVCPDRDSTSNATRYAFSVRNDLISLVPTQVDQSKFGIFEDSWIDHLVSKDVSVLVLNRGFLE